MRQILWLLFWGMTFSLAAQDAHSERRQATREYLNHEYANAELSYRKALEKETTPETYYNLGNTLYQQNKLEEAVPYFEKAAQQGDNHLKAKALYNLGNTFYKQQAFDKSFEAYRSALKANPDDEQLKENLINAFLKVQQQQQQQQQQQNNKNQSKDQKSEDQNQKNDQNQQQEQEQQNQGGKSDNQDKENPESSENEQKPSDQEAEQQQAEDVSKQEAERLLKLLDEQEKEVIQRMRKKGDPNVKPKKDW